MYFLFPLLLSLLMGALYLFTASRGMFWLDAPRFIAAIVTGGVSNPPEPLYMMLARPFTLLPVGSIVFRIQILSALLAVFTLFSLYILITIILDQIGQTGKNKTPFKPERILPAGLFGLFTLGFTYQFWTQSQNVENFVLVTLLDTLILIFIVLPVISRNLLSRFMGVAFLLGLASGTNPIVGSVAPSVLYVLWEKRKLVNIKKLFAIGLAGLTAVILVYSYVLIAASRNPFLNWKRPADLQALWGLSSGSGLNFNMPERGLVNGFTGSFDVFMLSSGNYFKMIWVNFTPVLLPFILLGGYFLFTRSRRLFWILFLTLGTNFLFSGIYLSGNQESWYLISDAVLAVFSGLGFFWLVDVLSRLAIHKFKAHVSGLITGIFFLLLALTLVFRWSTVDRRQWMITEDYVQNIYRSVKGPALLFGTYDLFDSNTYYAHALYGQKTKVIPLGVDYIYDMEWYKKNIALNTDLKFPTMKLKFDGPLEYSAYMNELFALNLPRYRIYLTIPALRNNFFPIANFGPSLIIDQTKYKLVPAGMVQELVLKDSLNVPLPEQYDYHFATPDFPHYLPVIYDRTFQIELSHMVHEYAQSYQLLADYALSNGRPELALEYYNKANDFDPENIEVLGRLGNFYGTYGDPVQGIEYFDKALALDPKNITFHYNLALLKKKEGDDQGATQELLKVIDLGKDPSQLTAEEVDLVKKADEIMTPPSTPKPSK